MDKIKNYGILDLKKKRINHKYFICIEIQIYSTNITFCGLRKKEHYSLVVDDEKMSADVLVN